MQTQSEVDLSTCPPPNVKRLPQRHLNEISDFPLLYCLQLYYKLIWVITFFLKNGTGLVIFPIVEQISII